MKRKEVTYSVIVSNNGQYQKSKDFGTNATNAMCYLLSISDKILNVHTYVSTPDDKYANDNVYVTFYNGIIATLVVSRKWFSTQKMFKPSNDKTFNDYLWQGFTKRTMPKSVFVGKLKFMHWSDYFTMTDVFDV